MALQPATGAKDLNPKQVETNHLLSNKLSDVYKLWGYQEVSPPSVERLATLTAGGAIGNEEIVKLVADEPLGLRPEMTASIARAACTRLAHKPRPLRLWASGTVFESRESTDGGISIEENLQCGVELFGIKSISGEMELLSILLDSLDKLELDKKHEPTLLIGHTSLIRMILSNISEEKRELIRTTLIDYDRLKLESIDLDQKQKENLLVIQELRGYPLEVLEELESKLGKNVNITNLKRLFKMLEPISRKHSLGLQLDPTFLPHFELYTGIVFQLICKGQSSPVVIARGGRYDELVEKCSENKNECSGLGFSFAIDKIRELQFDIKDKEEDDQALIIAYSNKSTLEDAINRQNYWHKKGKITLLELEPYENESQARDKIIKKGYKLIEWIEE